MDTYTYAARPGYPQRIYTVIAESTDSDLTEVGAQLHYLDAAVALNAVIASEQADDVNDTMSEYGFEAALETFCEYLAEALESKGYETIWTSDRSWKIVSKGGRAVRS